MTRNYKIVDFFMILLFSVIFENKCVISGFCKSIGPQATYKKYP